MSEIRSNTEGEIQDEVIPNQPEWTEPVVTDLPRLTDLTLQTGGGIPGMGGTGGGGSTVIF